MTLNFKNDTKWQWHKMTLFLFRTILIVHEKESYTPKFKVCVFYTYTATYSTVSCHSWPVSLNKSFYKWTNSRKMYYLCRRKAALGNLKASFHCARLHFLCRRKPASQQNIQASLIFCIRFAFSLHRQPKKVWQEPLRGHLLRPRSVTIDDQRRSSIKTPKEHYSKADRRHRATNKTPDTRAVTNAPTIS